MDSFQSLWNELDQMTKCWRQNEIAPDFRPYIPSSYQSCIRINGKPILPPVMTTEKRLECQRWRRKAIEVEKRIRKQNCPDKNKSETINNKNDVIQVPETVNEQSRYDNDNPIQLIGDVPTDNLISFEDDQDKIIFKEDKTNNEQNDNTEDKADQETDISLSLATNDNPRSSSGLPQPTQLDFTPENTAFDDLNDSINETPEKTNSAFKSLIHKLRRNIPSHEKFDEIVVDEESPSIDIDEKSPNESSKRQRNDSFTIDEPSPLLQAYLERYGDDDMSVSCKNAPKFNEKISNISSEKKTGLLNDFLSQVSSMPSSKTSTKTVTEETSTSMKNVTSPKIDTEENSVSIKNVTSPKIDTEENYVSMKNTISPTVETTSTIQNEDKIECKDPEDTSISSSVMNSITIDSQSQNVNLVSEDKEESNSKTTTNDDIQIEENSRINTNRELLTSSEPTEESETWEGKSSSDPITTVETPYNSSTARTESSTIAATQQENDISLIDDEKSSSTISVPSSTTKKLEFAVSQLAIEQKGRIQNLLEHQAQERENMKNLFEEQQKKLIEQIKEQIKSSSGNKSKSKVVARFDFDLPRSKSPIVPAVAPFARPLSVLPTDYQFPDEVYCEEMKKKFCKLTAIAKGYLTRRLLKTYKVENIIASMKDTMNMALQLHSEAAKNEKLSVSKQDIDLHRRLLQQLNKDSHDLNNIFFKIPTTERMAIIAIDHEIKKQDPQRKQHVERRLSEVTKATLERKQKQKEFQRTQSLRKFSQLRKDKENRATIRSKSLGGDAKTQDELKSSKARVSLYNITSTVSSSSNKETKKSSIPIPKRSLKLYK